MTDLDLLRADIAADPDLGVVLRAMHTLDDDAIPYARHQAGDLGMPTELWRQRVARLIAIGVATYGPLRDSDSGQPMGSSYWLTRRGTALREELELEAA